MSLNTVALMYAVVIQCAPRHQFWYLHKPVLCVLTSYQGPQYARGWYRRGVVPRSGKTTRTRGARMVEQRDRRRDSDPYGH
jgi:hypothetical protein